MSKIIIIYGTTGGNTELVCEKVEEVLKESGHEVQLKRAENSSSEDLADHDLIVLASPTYNVGQLQEQMHKFFHSLKEQDIKGRRFAVIGLGDSKYEINYMFESAKILEDGIKSLGGELVHESLKINMQPVPYLETRVTDWAKEISNSL
ncbi:hypothetical protein GF354_03805 [Candidatus Peregrinibacteria bacterium]|nr:hypothetical protein [Candidatus Peregrinibacteria bacterium]